MNANHLKSFQNPFPGLRPFQQDEDYLFFGREKQVAELLSLLRSNRFMAVVGTSGSGKSSLVRAGLIPALHRGTISSAGSAWEILIMRPEASPLENLARAVVDAQIFEDNADQFDRVLAMIRRSSYGLLDVYQHSEIPRTTNLLVIVDQFEELFRFRNSSDHGSNQASDFVNLLLQATQSGNKNVYVILTMRSDYLGDCSTFSGLAEAVNRGEYLIPRLSRGELKTAIVGPVQVGGAKIANRLVQKLLNSIADNSDQLPVLQHALMRTWSLWTHRKNTEESIDLEHFEAAGGMERALSQHAGEIYESLPPHRRKIAERLFRTLTELGADNRGIRRPTRFDVLQKIINVPESDLIHVIDAFRGRGRTFLMPSHGVPILHDTVIDISHESLMRAWDKLREWVELESQSARIYRRLADTAVLHEEGKSGLFRDPDLRIALSWRELNEVNEAWGNQYSPDFFSAMKFLDVSKAVQDDEEQAKEIAKQKELEQTKAIAELQRRRAEEQKKTTEKFKRLFYLMGSLAILAVLSGIASFASYRHASESQRRAEKSRQTAMLAASVSDWERNDSSAVRQRLESIPPESRNWEWRLLYAESSRSLELLLKSPFYEDGYHVGLSSSGTMLAIRPRGGNEQPIDIYDLSTKSKIASLETVSSNSGILTFSEDDSYLAYQHWGTPGVQIYSLKSNSPAIPLETQHNYFAFLGFSSDTQHAFLCDHEGVIEKVSLNPWKSIWKMEPIENFGSSNVPIGALDIRKETLAIALNVQQSNDQQSSVLKTLNVEKRSWQETASLQNFPNNLCFSGDGKTIIVDAGDSILEYDPRSLEVLRKSSIASDYRSCLISVALASGNILATVGAGGRLEIYDQYDSGLNRIASLSGASSPGDAVAVTSDKRRLVSAHRDGTVLLWDMRSFNSIPVDPYSLEIASDGSVLTGLSTSLGDGGGEQINELHPLTGERVRSYFQFPPDPRHGSYATAVCLSPTEDRIAVARETGWGHGNLRVFDRTLGTVLWDFENTESSGDFYCASWDSTGSLIAVGATDKYSGNIGEVHILDATKGTRVGNIQKLKGMLNAVSFTTDKDHVLTSTSEGVITCWNWREAKAVQDKSLVDKIQCGIGCMTSMGPSGIVAVGMGDGRIVLWHPTSGEVLRDRKVHGQPIVSIAKHPIESRLVTIDKGGALKILDSTNLDELITIKISGNPKSLRFDDHGEALFVATSSGMKVLDARNESIKSDLRDQYAAAREKSIALLSQLESEPKDQSLGFNDIRQSLLRQTDLSDGLKESALVELRRKTGSILKACYRLVERNSRDPSLLVPKGSSLSPELKRKLLISGNKIAEDRDSYYSAKKLFRTEISRHICDREFKGNESALPLIEQFVSDWDSFSGFRLPASNDIAWAITESSTSSFDDAAIAYFGMEKQLDAMWEDYQTRDFPNEYNTLALAEYRVGLYPLAMYDAEISNRYTPEDDNMRSLNALIAAASAHQMGNDELRDTWLSQATLSSDGSSPDEKTSVDEQDELLRSELRTDCNKLVTSESLNANFSRIKEFLIKSKLPENEIIEWFGRLASRLFLVDQKELSEELSLASIEQARKRVADDTSDATRRRTLARLLGRRFATTLDTNLSSEVVKLYLQAHKEGAQEAYNEILMFYVKFGMTYDGLHFLSLNPLGPQVDDSYVTWFLERIGSNQSFMALAKDWKNLFFGPKGNSIDTSTINSIVWDAIKASKDAKTPEEKDKIQGDYAACLALIEYGLWSDFKSSHEDLGSFANSLAVAQHRSNLLQESIRTIALSNALSEKQSLISYNKLLALMSEAKAGKKKEIESRMMEFLSEIRNDSTSDMDLRILEFESVQLMQSEEEDAYDEALSWAKLNEIMCKSVGGIFYMDWKAKQLPRIQRLGKQDLAADWAKSLIQDCHSIESVVLEPSEQLILAFCYSAAFNILRDEEMKAKAVEIVSSLQEDGPKSEGSTKNMIGLMDARKLWYIANTHYLCESWKTAEESLDSLLAAYPDFLNGWILKARLYADKKDDLKFKETTKKIEELAPRIREIQELKDLFAE